MKKLGLILVLTLTSMMAHAELVDPTIQDTQNLCGAFMARNEARVMCQAQIAVAIDQIRLNYIVEYVSDYTNETLNKDTLAKLVSSTQSHYPDIITRSVANKINSVTDLNEFKSVMFDQSDAAIYPMYNSTPLFRFTK